MDDEHLFITQSINMFSPLETLPEGYRDHICYLGSWISQNPFVMDSLKEKGITNVYRDIVNNEAVYLVPFNIDWAVEHIRASYDENAYAELVQPLSSELGIDVYRILS